jgi:hypothetical protein
MKNVIAIASVLAIAAGASANIMQMESLEFSFQLAPGSTTLNFQQFDTQNGDRVLKGMQIEGIGFIGALLTAENDSDIEVSNFGVNLVGLVDVNGPGNLDLSFGISNSAGPVSVGASDGATGSGPDFFDFGSVSGSDDDSTFLPAFQIPAAVVGNGTFPVTIDGNGGFSTTGTTDSTLRVQEFGASGSVKVTFFYDLIPTPGTVGLAGLAGLAGLRRRRA